MTEQQLLYFAELLRERKSVLEIAAKHTDDGSEIVELDQSRQGRLSRMDALQGQAMSLAARQRRSAEYKQVKAALSRIEQGEFGYCASCGEEIPVARLEFNPTVTQCVTCADKSQSR